ncbi:hypothetical protein HBI56_205640 [Parastagonospora nodorum]|uniref:Uncharacterized protein n=1 Tax=Phaeosphaeria nodorum (strain SN15 / ATCC MYA-4574 / FGSC 10173) TaxID=321614 RepID=A0A7U2FGV9_PHANO|nr:hypothetical protein HBH56_115650 [Parastagonospora nodorum]QRD05054.1 hypothetical protein JI435_421960 [Parastagonospora nodorum SN15]KAH3928897.1 hypothetical protein HBH54_133500 [Parastagonospora nodorum]KAH3950514.1 hypothetical protein HBH53_073800 [Parastagonospora nodorum]KAH3965913.1 hypothetical protein HBH51_147960 [Parastagonospora nodorum]
MVLTAESDTRVPETRRQSFKSDKYRTIARSQPKAEYITRDEFRKATLNTLGNDFLGRLISLAPRHRRDDRCSCHDIGHHAEPITER